MCALQACDRLVPAQQLDEQQERTRMSSYVARGAWNTLRACTQTYVCMIHVLRTAA